MEEAASAKRASLDLMSQRYRVVLSLREDFLPELKNWEKKIPSLSRHFLRLEPMSRWNAVEAVEQAGAAVIEPGVAPHIVDFVGRQKVIAGHLPAELMTIEPVLLSLCCSELNRRRPSDGKIGRALLDEAGEDILKAFYRDALADDDVKGLPDVEDFIESYLIQGDRFRGSYPVAEAIEKGFLTQRQIEALTDRRRLLRVVQYSDAARVELIHDRLVPVVSNARTERRQLAEQYEHQRRAEEARAELAREQARADVLRRERNNFKVAAILAGVACVATIGFAIQAWRASDKEERTRIVTDLSLATSHLANQRLALKSNKDPWEETAFRALAAYRMSDDPQYRTNNDNKAKANALIALRTYLERHPHLRRVLNLSPLEPTTALAYSPDGATLALGARQGQIHLLNARSLKETKQLDCGVPGNAVWTLAFSEDGKRIAAGYTGTEAVESSGAICVFDVAQGGAPIRRWTAKDQAGKGADIDSVAFGHGPAGEIVVSGGTDHMLRVWDLASGRMNSYLENERKEVSAVAVSKDRRTVAAGSEDGSIWLLDLGATDKGPIQLESPGKKRAHNSTVQQIAFAPDNPAVLLSAGDDGRVKVWDVKANCLSQQSTKQRARLYGLAISADTVATAGADGAVRLMRMLDKTCAPSPGATTDFKLQEFGLIPEGLLTGHGNFVYAVAFSPTDGRIASTGEDGSLRTLGTQHRRLLIGRVEVGSRYSRGS